jgi:hypothetical protein
MGQEAYRKGDIIQAVIDNNFGPVTPDVVEQVRHNSGGLVPYQFVISLAIAFIRT